jgi:hypothetical protein
MQEGPKSCRRVASKALKIQNYQNTHLDKSYGFHTSMW